MKNLLAENMLRFRAKNLSEPAKQKIVKLAEIISEQGTERSTFQLLLGNKPIGFRFKGGQDIYHVNIKNQRSLAPKHKGYQIEAEVPGVFSFKVNITPQSIMYQDLNFLSDGSNFSWSPGRSSSDWHSGYTFKDNIQGRMKDMVQNVPYFLQLQQSLAQSTSGKLAEIISEQGTERETFQLNTDYGILGFREATIQPNNEIITDFQILQQEQRQPSQNQVASYHVTAGYPGLFTADVVVTVDRIVVNKVNYLKEPIDAVIWRRPNGSKSKTSGNHIMLERYVTPRIKQYIPQTQYFQQLQQSLAQSTSGK